MTDTPLVSICMPAFDAAPFIALSIESVLAQSYPAVELVIVDDGSRDGTYEIARRYASDRVRVERQENGGAASARNRAWSLASGPWIQFLDADDVMHPEKIRAQMTKASAAGSHYAYCCRWGRFFDAPSGVTFDDSPLLADLAPCDWLTAKYRANAMMHSGSWLVHRAVLEAAGPWNERLTVNDDGEFFDRVVLASRGVRYVPEAEVYYRSGRIGTLSRAVSRSAAESAWTALSSGAERLLAACPGEAAREACAIQYQLLAFWSFPRHRDLAARAAARAAELGMTSLDLPGGAALRALQRVVGWKIARTLQHLYYEVRRP